MARFTAAFAICLSILLPGAARSADNPAAGTWKFTLFVETQQGARPLTFLVMLSESDKGWVGDVLGVSLRLPREPKFDTLTVKDDNVSFTIKIEDLSVGFDGRVVKNGKKIRGSLAFQGKTTLIDVVPSRLKELKDSFAIARDAIDMAAEGDNEYFDSLFEVLASASPKKKEKGGEPKGKADEPKGKGDGLKEKLDEPPAKIEGPKLKLEEVRAVVDKASKFAEPYGPRWQRTVAARIASILIDQEPFVAIALEQSRQVERMLRPDDPALTQMEILANVAQILRKAGKHDEVKPIELRLTKLEARDFADYSKKFPPFKPEEFKGRKGKSDRVVLAELFTGAECPPCVGVDLAFDALESTYKPTELVLLQYHLHIPGPDPMTNKDSIDRSESYGGKVRGTPTIFFSGKRDETKGGAIGQAKLKYKTYCETIDELLEKDAGAKLQLSASQKGTDIAIKAIVSDLAKPGEMVVLRFALTEERVRYAGGNGLRYHHCVVRAMPGGFKGFPLTKKDAEQTVSVSLDKVREEITKHLDAVAKEEEFPGGERPLSLKNLRVVAFIQDDATGDVLQAAQVEVEQK
jgi:hypothetical protein